jgi:hypothetical protein
MSLVGLGGEAEEMLLPSLGKCNNSWRAVREGWETEVVVDSGKRGAPRGNKLEHIGGSTSGGNSVIGWEIIGIRMPGDGRSMDRDLSEKSVVDRKCIMESNRWPGGREWEWRCRGRIRRGSRVCYGKSKISLWKSSEERHALREKNIFERNHHVSWEWRGDYRRVREHEWETSMNDFKETKDTYVQTAPSTWLTGAMIARESIGKAIAKWFPWWARMVVLQSHNAGIQ